MRASLSRICLLLCLWLLPPMTAAALTVPEADSPAPTAGAFISIPRLGLYSPIVQFPIINDPQLGGIWYIAPEEAYVGHLLGTALPGMPGNSVLGGHSEYPDGSPGVFHQLHSLQAGDEIQLSRGGLKRRYQVTDIFTVAFDDVSVVYPTAQDRLTLLTCTSYSPSQQIYLERVIVVAEPLPPSP